VMLRRGVRTLPMLVVGQIRLSRKRPLTVS